MTRFRPRLSFANVVSMLALFVALGGSALAVGIARDSIKSKQIKDGAVKTAELADDAVTSAKVDDGSLLGKDFAAGQVPEGPQGPQGVQGPAGTAGTARAYGFVDANTCTGTPGDCPVTDAKGIASVRRTSVGRYCVAVPGISADEVPADVAVEFSLTSTPFGNSSVSTVNNPGSGCPNLGDFLVKAMRQPPTDVRNSADTGSTSVAGNAVDSDAVSFTIIVP